MFEVDHIYRFLKIVRPHFVNNMNTKFTQISNIDSIEQIQCEGCECGVWVCWLFHFRLNALRQNAFFSPNKVLASWPPPDPCLSTMRKNQCFVYVRCVLPISTLSLISLRFGGLCCGALKDLINFFAYGTLFSFCGTLSQCTLLRRISVILKRKRKGQPVTCSFSHARRME
jgi:hypothetical protein